MHISWVLLFSPMNAFHWNLKTLYSESFTFVENKWRNLEKNTTFSYLQFQRSTPEVPGLTQKYSIPNQSEIFFILAGTFIVLHLQFLLHPARSSTVSFFLLLLLEFSSAKALGHFNLFLSLLLQKSADKLGAEFSSFHPFASAPFSSPFSLLCV